MNIEDFRQLSAGHALHALSPDDELAYVRALSEHPEWRDLVDADQETAAELGDAVPDAVPSEGVRSSLLELIASTPQIAASGSPDHEAPPRSDTRDPLGSGANDQGTLPAHSGRRRAVWAGAFALAASLLIFASISLGPDFFGSHERDDPAVIALAEVAQSSDARAQTVNLEGGGQATVHWSLDLDRAVFVAEDLPKLRGDEDFELWLVRGDTPISAGVFESKAPPTILADFQPGDVVAVTVEQSGGSPSGNPTSDPILAITTA